MRCMLYSTSLPGSDYAKGQEAIPQVLTLQYTEVHTTGDLSTPTGTLSGATRVKCVAAVSLSITAVRYSPHTGILYRLMPPEAPQYPFPCAIQDVLAAYLYLVNPPPDAPHRPVKPEHIVIAGDSAGGGLVLALLQILRDVEGLQLPAGAALISPVSHAPAIPIADIRDERRAV